MTATITFQTDTTGRTNRWTGRCASCHTRIVEHHDTPRSSPRRYNVECPTCDESRVPVTQVIAYTSTKKCDARCVNAKRHDCECSCGGKNHGTAA
jgi:hypothetical protein